MSCIIYPEVVFAQNRRLPSTPPSSTGTFHVYPDYAEPTPTSVEGLIKSADSVVDGTIVSITARVRDGDTQAGKTVDNDWTIISDIVVDLGQVVRGKTINKQFMFHRFGGTVGDRKIVNLADKEELKVGDRLIIFLSSLKTPSPNSAIPHFAVVGRSVGRWRVAQNNTIVIDKQASSELAALNGVTVQAAVEKIKQTKID